MKYLINLTILGVLIVLLTTIKNEPNKECATPRPGLKVCIQGEWTTVSYHGPAQDYRRGHVEAAIDSLKRPKLYQ